MPLLSSSFKLVSLVKGRPQHKKSSFGKGEGKGEGKGGKKGEGEGEGDRGGKGESVEKELGLLRIRALTLWDK